MSWLHVRPRTLAGAAIVSVAAIGITTMAVAYEGNPTTELELNDGAVWITKTDQQLVGHFNAESEVLDGRFAAPTADYDVLQDGDRALVHDLGDDTLGAIDTAAVALGESVQLPADALVDYAASTIAVLDVAKGALHVVPYGGLGEFSVAAAKPVLDKLGENAVVTVGRDGTVYAVSPERSTLYTLPVTPEGDVDKDTIREQELEGVGEGAVLSITSVGEVPVLLDEDAGAVIVPDGPTLPLDEPDDARLALDAADGDAVVVATRTQLLRLPLDGSDPTATPAGATSGTPAEPVWLNGCAYGAWMESGRFLRDCVGEADDLSSAIRDYKAGGELRFRVNRDVVMLNDVMSGAAWLASDVLQKVDNWDDLTPPKGDGVENPDPTTVQVPDPSPPDRGEDNTPPIANPDRFGVRAGASTILPVLDNDSDPDGDVLVISLPDGSPPGVEVQLINDGTSLQIAVPAGVTSVDSFRYEISDGRPGGTAETTVGIDVHPDAENAAPKQLREIAVPVETGSSVTYNVLPDWIDPDGDNIYLESVTPAEGDEAEFTADGRITYRAISGNQGPTDVNITVSDGDASMTGVFKLDVRASGSTPPLATADHMVVRAGQQGTVAPLANDLSASDEPLELTQVSEVQGASIVTDYASDTFTFESGTVGTYYVDYLVTTSGTAPVPGIVRVDVIEPVESDDPPVAVRDVALLPVGGDALVNVLANDSDPAGGVLVVQSVEAAEDSGVSVSVLGHESLRVTDRGMTTEGGEVTIRYTISNGAASAEGEVVVIALPSPSKLRAPVVNPDSAVVRVGDVVTIPVLENDYHPNDDEFHVDPELVEVPDPAAGEAFVSQDGVRFRAGDQPGTVYVTYAAVDSTGQRAATQVAIQVMPLDDENNNTPRPEDIEARALAGTQTTIAIPLDRIDGDGDSVELIGLASGPKKGTIVETGADRLVYEAFRDASGLDTFAYRVRDPFGAEATATIRVGIAPAAAQNQQPYAVRDSLAMRPGRVVAAPVLENDSDPDGDRFGLIQGAEGLILGEDPAVEAEAVGNRVIVTAPDRELETSLQYTIEDARGARAQGVLQITVDEDVPLQSPIARDDRVLIGDIDPESQTAEIPLLENDEDPDGTAEALEIALETDDGAELIGDGSARVSVQETRRLIGYTVTDEDGQSSKAFIHVPGQEDLRPTLLDTEPAQVQSGKSITLPLADYVKAASGNSVRLTEAEKVTSGHGDGSSLVVDAQTLTYTSAYRYSGSDAVTFEVTDGSGPDDPKGRVSTLSIPITVTAPVNEPPEMVGASVRVGAGDTEPGVVELSGLATDIDNDPLTFELVEVPDGIEAAIEGSTLSVTAEADQKGTVGTITVGVDDGEENPESPEPVTAPIEVTVTASTRELPVATDDTFAEWNQGETLTVPVLDNDVNPFAGEAPLTVTNAQLEVGSSQDASVEFDDDSVSITPAEDFHGRLVVRYQVEDQTGDPDRTAEARVNVTVQGRPDAPPKASVSNVQSRQLTLTWRPPADNGASITEYRVTAVKGGEYETVCPETTCTLTGLTNNVTYAFAVTAVNKVGESDASPASQEGRPDVRPHVPAAPQLPQFRDGGLQVTWKAPGNEGSPITKYELEITPAPPNGVNTKTVPAGATQLWWDGLANGTAYTVRVRAHNSAPDPSDWSPQSGTNIPAKPPAAPGAASVKRQSSIGSTAGGVEVTWPAVQGADAGGDAVDTYQVQAYRGGNAYGDVHSTSGTRYVVTLPASTADYTFQVRAKNKAGWGAWSKASTPLRQFTSPTAPGTPNVKAGDGWVEASWSAATAEGASSGEIQYSYSVNGGAWTPVGTATSATIGGLQNGTSYRVAVRAHAVAGGVQSESGPASAQSSAAVPFGPPAAPAAQAVPSGAENRAITYSWSSPANSNGRDITALEISVDGGAWQSRPLSDSEQVQYDYEQTHTIAVRVQNSEGQWSAETSASGRTADRPKPAATVSASERNRGVGDGCNGRCHYLQLNYENFPAGDYSIVCRDYNDGGSGFATVKRTLSGAGSSELGCFYGFEGKEVWLDVTGPNGFSLSTPRWIYQHPS
ncbi:Ig-like domain-containing protein [Microbacterium marinilacus]|nr:Ig-like domain-containing protein [Microbacterium marinilacus]